MTDPLVKRSTTRCQIGAEVDEMTVTLMLGNGTTIQGVPAAEFAVNGGFDGGQMSVDRFYASAWDSVVEGSVNVFTGNIAQVDTTAVDIALSVKSELERLNMQLPRVVFMAQCRHTLFDTGCTLDAADFTDTLTVQAGSTAGLILTTSNRANAYFQFGVIEFLDGDNEGEIRRVRSFIGANATLSLDLPFAPAPGDSFTLTAGCDKLLPTCNGRFDNRLNYGGQPFIPAPEATM